MGPGPRIARPRPLASTEPVTIGRPATAARLGTADGAKHGGPGRQNSIALGGGRRAIEFYLARWQKWFRKIRTFSGNRDGFTECILLREDQFRTGERIIFWPGVKSWTRRQEI